jgi:xylulokinase
MGQIAVGIDVGTSSVKAIAADEDGNVVARSRVPHAFNIPTATRLEHPAREAWYDGPRAALAELGVNDYVGVSVAAMVPSLCPVDETGVPIGPGILYGDDRGHGGTGSPAENGELVGFLAWLAQEYPQAAGYWPAQAVANAALGGEGVLDTSTAATAFPLFDWTKWDPAVAEKVGARVEQFPRLVPTAWNAGTVKTPSGPSGAVLASGCIDAMAEQMVAGADHPGDMLVILGTTLISWAVVPQDKIPEPAGYYSIPHTAEGCFMTGGPSNAGGLFLNWATGLLGDVPDGVRPTNPGSVPVWAPYPRGERSPLDDNDRRAQLVDLDLTHDAVAVRRAAFEASGFVVRRLVEAAGSNTRRIVLTGGGVRVDDWVQAIADATGIPVDCALVPEGGALGSAFLARMAAGLEKTMRDAQRWAKTGRTVEPDPAWKDAMDARFARFLELSQ